VWAVVDIGRAIVEIARGHGGVRKSDNIKDKTAAAALDVLRCVPRPVLAACGAFSFSSSRFGLPLPLVVAFVDVMPSLTQLHLIVSEEYSDVPSADLTGLIPAADVAEWRGRGWWPADEKVTVAHLLRAISSLTCLTDLTIDLRLRKEIIPATFPQSLRRLTVALCDSDDISVLFGAGPHNQIRELEIHTSGVQAVRACPEITALTVHDFNGRLTQEDLDIILGTCRNLQRLCVNSADDHFSFARLESSPCARSLTSIKVDTNLAPGSVEVISRCCPAIEELSVRGVGPADVHAMASLMRLRVLEVSHDLWQDQGPELSEAFTTLGNTEGAIPLTRLVLRYTKFDVTGLFSSPRCSALRELKLISGNGLTDQAMQALATNVRDSLMSLMLSWTSAAPVVPLLVECRRLECLILYRCNTEGMRIIGQTCKAPLKSVKITGIRMIDAAVRAVVPVLAGVVYLDIDCPAKAILQHIIPRCPYLRVLRVRSPDIARQLRSEIPKHITVISSST
jgi:hypothetical protein